MQPSAKVIADSVSPSGERVTTMQLRMHRFILAEFNTSRMFSRNTSSSRAIPVHTLRRAVRDHPAIPVSWGKNKKGMQAEEELDIYSSSEADEIWRNAARDAAGYAADLEELGVHKQVANRLLEPFMWANTIVTSTEWDNFFKLRLHRDAQPEFQKLASLMKKAMDESTPKILNRGEWHLPHADDGDFCNRCVQSVARCARVSYLTFEGKQTTLDADRRLYTQLLESGHMSPFEHQCTPGFGGSFYYNLCGWYSLRYKLDKTNRNT